MTLVEVLGHLQLLAFAAAALAALAQWRRQRSRPAAYLAGAFGLICLVLLAVRLGPDAVTGRTWFSALALGALAAFPWLLAAFTWAFAGPLPRWLRLAGLAVPALMLWAATLPPLIGTESRTPAQAAFIVVFLLLWSVLAVAMAARLWRAGGRQRLVRARMRLMAAAALLLTVALLLSAATGAGSSPTTRVVTSLLALSAAGLFVAGFAPPLPLRVWWRRRSSQQFQRMQVALIGAATPQGVAEAVAPMVADLLGGGVLIVDDEGEVLAASHLTDHEVAEVLALLASPGPLPDDLSTFDVARACMVVRRTAYTPVFGQDEYELVEAFSIQLRLALERAQLYRSEQLAREEAQTVRADLESTLYSLSHDLKSPSLAISGFADLLPSAADQDERDETLHHIKASAAYLNQLVDALLELSRIGRTQTGTGPVDLGEVAARVARRHAISHPQATVTVSGALPTIEINEVRAEQLLDNLVGNALVHGGRDDIAVTIAAHHADTHLELSVADDGHGVPAEDRERIFELFQRGSTSGGRGSGVGLGMVRRIAEASDGTLELADSEIGARFVVHFPARLLVAGTGAAPGVGDATAAPAADQPAGR